MTRYLKILPVLAGLLLLMAACTSENKQSEKKQASESKQAPGTKQTDLQKAPNFKVVTIKGDTVSLAQSLEVNKPMVVYFTASWCPICAKNWPVLSEVYSEYKDRLNMVAISIDPSDTEKVMSKLAREKNFAFPVTKGYPDVMVDFGVNSQATTVGINSDGYIVFQKNKTALSADEYRTLFDRLVN